MQTSLSEHECNHNSSIQVRTHRGRFEILPYCESDEFLGYCSHNRRAR
jgi:hypothetical protein